MSVKDTFRAAVPLMDKHADALNWIAFVSGLLGVTFFIVGASLDYNRDVGTTGPAQESEFRASPLLLRRHRRIAREAARLLP